MTTATLTRPGRLGRLRLGGLFQALIERESHHRQMRLLIRMDDHQLRDIGLTRDDLPRR